MKPLKVCWLSAGVSSLVAGLLIIGSGALEGVLDLLLKGLGM